MSVQMACQVCLAYSPDSNAIYWDLSLFGDLTVTARIDCRVPMHYMALEASN